MNSIEWQRTIRIAIRAGSRTDNVKPWKNTFMLWGPPAVGKTQSTEEAFIGEKCPRCMADPAITDKSTVHDVPVVTRHLSEMMPEDLRGVLIYNPVKDLAKWHHNPDWHIGEKCPVFYLLDEFNQAEKPTQKSALEFTHKFSIGGEALPKGSAMALAGNRVEDGADVEELIRPQRTRVTHIEYEFSEDAWRTWALRNGVHPMVTSYLAAKAGMLYKPDLSAERGECLPRTWVKVSDIMYTYDGPDADLQSELVQGTVGDAAGGEFMAWAATAGTLMPMIESILKGKDVVTEELSSQFFISGVLVDRFNRDRKLAERLCQYSIFSADSNPEAAAIMLKDAAKVDRDRMLNAPSWKKSMARLSQYMTA